MTTAYWCVLVAGLMPILFTGIAKATGKRFDNRSPREWQARLEGMPARAHAAHLNAFEAFPLFAVAVIIAQLRDAPQDRIDQLAIAFVVLRLAYGFAYMANQATLRSVIWILALGCAVALFFIG